MAVIQPCMSEPKTDSDEESVLPQAKREQVFHPFISQTQSFPQTLLCQGPQRGMTTLLALFCWLFFLSTFQIYLIVWLFYSQTSLICVFIRSMFTYTYKKCHLGI